MVAAQVFALNELVARHLDLEVPAGARARELRRGALPCADVATLAERILDGGRRLDLAWLERRLGAADLEGALDDEVFPLVLLAAEAAGFRVIVVLERVGRRLRGRRVLGDGRTEAFEVARDELAAFVLGTPVVRDAQLVALVPLGVPAAAAVLAPARGADAAPPTPMARLWALLGAERANIGLIYLYAALAGLFSLALPLSVQMIVGLVSGGMLLQPVVLLIAFVVLGTLIAGVLQIMQLSVVELIQQRVFARMAFDFSFRLPRVSLEHAGDEDLVETMNRFFEVKTIQKSLAKLLTDSVTATLQVVFGLVLLTFYHPYFTLFGLLLLGGLVAIIWATGPRGLSTSLTESKYKYQVQHWLEELARTLGTFKFAGRSNMPLERMDAEVAGYLKYRRKHFRVLVWQSAGMVAFKTIITGGLLVLGTLLVLDRQISLGQFVASELVIVTVLVAVEKLIIGLADVYDILTSVEKAGHVADLPVDRVSGIAMALDPREHGLAIEARGLTYRYPGSEHTALEEISLVVRAGERVGITGPEGAGESTLFNVLTGVLEGYDGGLAFDGLPARDIEPSALRALIGRATDQVELFEGTLEENISLGRPQVSTHDVLWAAERAGLLEYVQALPEGFGTRVHAGGRPFNSQLQRKIVLARCIAGRPRLLAFDDFFDDLEPAVRADVIALLGSSEVRWTVVAVSHDPMYLSTCDRVFLMDDGRLVRSGTWEELRSDPFFQALAGPSLAMVR